MAEDSDDPQWLVSLRDLRARAVPEAAWRRLTEELWPGAEFVESEPLVGGLSALLDRLVAVDADGARVTAIVRRILPEQGYRPEHVTREAETLAVLAAHDVPAPRLKWSDPSGEVFGRAALAMSELPGRSLGDNLDADGAALAGSLLAQFHRVPATAMEHIPDPGDLGAQIDGLLSREPQPEQDIVDRDGLDAAIRRGSQVVAGLGQTVLHNDFHAGNVLRDGATVAVVDLTDAGRGDPGRDLGYCRLDFALTAVEGTMEAFTAGYGEAGGVVPEHLWFYDLLGGLRCLPTPAHWLPAFHAQGRTDLTAEQVEDRARRFIDDALDAGAAAGAL